MHRVVIIGGGFAGLFAAKRLRHVDVDVQIIDRSAQHVFQPLLYQVATGVLSPGDVAPPLRHVLRHQANARVLLGEVTAIDVAHRTVSSAGVDGIVTSPFDSLIVAAGATTSYFGDDAFADHAPGLKDVDDALEIRGRVFGAFEQAERGHDAGSWQTFVVVGAGPTGVELAGQIAELRRSLHSEFSSSDPIRARVLLVDAQPRILTSYDDRLAARAERELRRLGVELVLGARVTALDEHGIELVTADGASRRVEARTKIWAAGVQASPLGPQLAAAAGIEPAQGGRVPVRPDLTLPGHPDVFVVGDLMQLDALPGVAEVAIQSGLHAAAQIARRVEGDAGDMPFRYRDAGSIAAVSRFYAIVQRGRLRLSGRPAWVVWLFVHLVFLTGFKGRAATLVHWCTSLFGRSRDDRTVTLHQVLARQALAGSRGATAVEEH